MSGTSLDGLDIACCTFTKKADGDWTYEITAGECYEYDSEWKQKLNEAPGSNGLDLLILHKQYGSYIAEHINSFIRNKQLKPGLIASHGHTVFHQPEKKLSFQLGDGAAIYSLTGIAVVCDFRSVDVCLGGQGAPLVPVGDALLFKEYDYCLNLGGIANISYDKDGCRIGFDICGCNLLLNAMANEIGLDYDDKGQLAKNGSVDQSLLRELNNWGYYTMPSPKSLDKEKMLSELLPIVRSVRLTIEGKLATLTEHIALQISKSIEKKSGSILITGGGAFNKALTDKIAEKTALDVNIPSSELIQFKEALVFAFLGLLRALNENNTLAFVTGADRDSMGGALYGKF